MSIYLVGPDNKSLFHQRSTWDFDQALAAAEDGDTIELQEGFNPSEFQEGKSASITKSITIQGTVKETDEGTTFTNTIDGVYIANGATVALKDLILYKWADQSNNVRVTEGATLILDDVSIASGATEGKNYPAVYIDDHSTVQFNQVVVHPGEIHDGSWCVYAADSEINLTDCDINAKLKIVNSTLLCENSTVTYAEANAVNISKKSVATIKSSTIEGGNVKSGFPCLRLDDSSLTADNIKVIEPNYNAALYGVDSNLVLNDGEFDSALFNHSDVQINYTKFIESLHVQKHSTVKSENNIFINGRANGKINLWATENSAIEAKGLYFGRTTTPNIKLERNVKFKVPSLKFLEYDQETETFTANEQGKFPFVKDASQIDYFGDKTAWEKLNELVGIKIVKDEITEFIAVTEVNKKRADQGFKSSAITLHSLFLGNPGTGKTTVARIVGELLYEKGIIAKNTFIEASRSTLVGQYVGHTAQKTKEVLESALGGVLFIDEAYTLASETSNDFGHEAIDEILKFMEDHRSDIVIIFAGYTDSMEKFLAMNEGLRSRIPNRFTFEDYSEDELVQMGLIQLHAQGLKIDKDAYTDLIHHNFSLSDDHSNGRWVRNLNEKLIRKQAVRLSGKDDVELTTLTQEDIQAAYL